MDLWQYVISSSSNMYQRSYPALFAFGFISSGCLQNNCAGSLWEVRVYELAGIQDGGMGDELVNLCLRTGVQGLGPWEDPGEVWKELK